MLMVILTSRQVPPNYELHYHQIVSVQPTRQQLDDFCVCEIVFVFVHYHIGIVTSLRHISS